MSISAQLKALREYAAKNGHIIVRELIDEAESGTSSARPRFREMISLAKRLPRPFDAILVYKYSRFARNREDSVMFKAMLRKCGVDVVSITEPHDNSPTGKLMEALIEGLDEFYSQNLGEEVTRGLRESASRGFYLSGRKPYGYRKVRVMDGSKQRTKLEIEPTEASVVKDVFQSLLQGKGLIEIAKELNEKGIAAPRAKGWSKTGLYEIVTNELCTGVFTWGRNSKRGLEPIRAENACPPIIDKETFAMAQLGMRDRAPAKNNPRRVGSRFLLSGLAKCGYCGKTLIGQDAKSGQFSYYICGSLAKKGAGACPAKYLNSVKFERLVTDKMKERILTPENLRRLVEIVNSEMDSASTLYQEEIDTLSSELVDTNRRLGRLYEVIENGALNFTDLAPRVKELRARQESLHQRKAEIETVLADRRVQLLDPETVKADVEDMHNLLSEGSLAERRSFIRTFVKEVKVTGDHVSVVYTPPLPPDCMPVEAEGGVPRTVRYGGR